MDRVRSEAFVLDAAFVGDFLRCKLTAKHRTAAGHIGIYGDDRQPFSGSCLPNRESFNR
jgi:hypothetical protein